MDKSPPEDGEPEPALLPFFFGVTEDAVVLVVAALNQSPDGQPARLVAESSTDIGFLTGVRSLGVVEIPANDDPFDFPCRRAFTNSCCLWMGWSRTAAILSAPIWAKCRPDPDAGEPVENVFLEGFATDAEGNVRDALRSARENPGGGRRGPASSPSSGTSSTTAQTAFSNRSGRAGADLRMSDAIGAGHNGAGGETRDHRHGA